MRSSAKNFSFDEGRRYTRIVVFGLRPKDFERISDWFTHCCDQLVDGGYIGDGPNMVKQATAKAYGADLILLCVRFCRTFPGNWSPSIPKVHFRSVSEIKRMLGRK